MSGLLFSLVHSGPATAQQRAKMPLFETTKIAEGVLTFRCRCHRTMFVVTDEGVMATDPITPTAADAMMGEIQKVTDKPVKYVRSSHAHWDHIGGGETMSDNG